MRLTQLRHRYVQPRACRHPEHSHPPYPTRGTRACAAKRGKPGTSTLRYARNFCAGSIETSSATTRGASRAAPTPTPARRGAHRRRGVLVIGWLVAAGLLLTSSTAWAETVHIVALARTVDEVLSNIRNWIMGVLAALAVVYLTIGGLRYLIASGDPGEVEKAKGAFKSAGIGFGLAALAPLVVEILKGIVGGV